MAKKCQIELFLTIKMTLFLRLEFSEFLIGGLEHPTLGPGFEDLGNLELASV